MSSNERIMGICKFCGQVSGKEFKNVHNVDEADEAATMDCDCADAKDYQRKVKQRITAKETIRKLCSVNGCLATEETVIELLESAVDLISDDKFASLSMSIPDIGTVKLSVNTKNGIVVERKKTISKKVTVDKW